MALQALLNHISALDVNIIFDAAFWFSWLNKLKHAGSSILFLGYGQIHTKPKKVRRREICHT